MTNWLGSFDVRKILLAAALLLVCQPAFADKRVALILGNSAYQNAPPLSNPVNDSALIADRLKAAGFDVVDSRHDLTALQTRRALRGPEGEEPAAAQLAQLTRERLSQITREPAGVQACAC